MFKNKRFSQGKDKHIKANAFKSIKTTHLSILTPGIFVRYVNQFHAQDYHPSSHTNSKRDEHSSHVTKVQLIAAFLGGFLGSLCLCSAHAAAFKPFLSHAL